MWVLGSLSADFALLINHAENPVKMVWVGLFYILPDYGALNYGWMAAYQIKLPWRWVAGHMAYSVLYGVILLTVLAKWIERRDI